MDKWIIQLGQSTATAIAVFHSFVLLFVIIIIIIVIIFVIIITISISISINIFSILVCNFFSSPTAAQPVRLNQSDVHLH
jgi:hypothetical protein